jgi:hypothetical protein
MSARALEGFPEFIPSTSARFRAKAPFIDESPALTAVLQAQPGAIVPSGGAGGVASACFALDESVAWANGGGWGTVLDAAHAWGRGI